MLAPKQIKKTILGILFSSLCFGSSTADVYLVVGDSLSNAHKMPIEQGWVALLEKQLRQIDSTHKVINVSVDGDHARRRAKCTLTESIPCLKKDLKKYNPDWVIIALGGNDALNLAPTKDIYKSLKTMVALSIKRGAKVVLAGINLPPDVPMPEQLSKKHSKQAFQRYAKNFNPIYPRLASIYNIRFAPNILKNILTNPDLMQPDGIHANAKAQVLIKNYILEAMKQIPE